MDLIQVHNLTDWKTHLPVLREWKQSGRIRKGGGWIGADFCCEPSFRAHLEANGKGPDQGFRVCRSSKPGA